MKTFEPGAKVLVNVNGGTGRDEPDWRPAVVTHHTNQQYGWTAARTICGIQRGPGWLQDEIRAIEAQP